MAGNNNFNAATMAASVFDKDGNVITTTRPNARELVANGTHFWRSEDIGVKRTEASGPENPAATEFTIYRVDTGEELTTTRQNARELVAGKSYTWVQAHAVKDEEPEVPVVSVETPQAPAPQPDPDADPLDPMKSPLSEIAARVTGSTDVAAYLETFTERNLKDLLEERYGEKAHARAGKESVIKKIVELEEARLSADSE